MFSSYIHTHKTIHTHTRARTHTHTHTHTHVEKLAERSDMPSAAGRSEAALLVLRVWGPSGQGSEGIAVAGFVQEPSKV